MPRSQKKVLETESKQANRQTLFGPPPLHDGEDSAAYDELLACVSSKVKPVDIIEKLLVRDVVDLSWDVLRLRRLRAHFNNASFRQGLEETLEQIVSSKFARRLLRGWTAQEPDTIDKIKAILAYDNRSLEGVAAQTLVLDIDDIEKIDRLIMVAETRRNSVLREIDRHRRALGDQLRHATQSVDAEFSVVPLTDRGPRALT